MEDYWDVVTDINNEAARLRENYRRAFENSRETFERDIKLLLLAAFMRAPRKRGRIERFSSADIAKLKRRLEKEYRKLNKTFSRRVKDAQGKYSSNVYALTSKMNKLAKEYAERSNLVDLTDREYEREFSESIRSSKRDPTKWIFGFGKVRLVGENLQRWTSGLISAKEVLQEVHGLQAAPHWDLCFTPYGDRHFRAVMGRLLDKNRLNHLVCVTSPRAMKRMLPDSREMRYALRVFTIGMLVKTYQDMNRMRRYKSDWRDFGIGYNTEEIYYPVPRDKVEIVKKIVAKLRKSMLSHVLAIKKVVGFGD